MHVNKRLDSLQYTNIVIIIQNAVSAHSVSIDHKKSLFRSSLLPHHENFAVGGGGGTGIEWVYYAMAPAWRIYILNISWINVNNSFCSSDPRSAPFPLDPAWLHLRYCVCVCIYKEKERSMGFERKQVEPHLCRRGWARGRWRVSSWSWYQPEAEIHVSWKRTRPGSACSWSRERTRLPAIINKHRVCH